MTKDARPIDAPEGTDKLLEEYALAEAEYTQARDKLRDIKKRVVALFPHDTIGKYQIEAGKWQATLTVPEKVKWNGEELIAYYGADLPVFVDRKLSISETNWSRLPTDERMKLVSARDISAGTPALEVEVLR